MEARHKDILRTNRGRLIEEISDIKRVVYALEENDVITGYMLEDIMAQSTKTDQKRELFGILPRRGQEAFDKFYDILVNNGEGSAADILKPELASQRKANQKQRQDAARQPDIPPPEYGQHIVTSPSDDDDELPESWPDEMLVSESVTVKLCDTYPQMLQKFQKSSEDLENIYKHQSRPRGIALIINNESFELARSRKCNLENRFGTENDMVKLDALLSQLHYKVEINENLTAEELQKCIASFGNQDHGHYDSFVLFVLSHGEKENIYGVDGELVTKEHIISSFNGKNCPTLSGKPKLFFFQACQGKNVDPGVPQTTEEVSSMSSSEPDKLEITLKKMKELNLKSDTVSDVKMEPSIPVEGDVFIASATIADYLSWRNTKHGTWFIQAIVFIFKNFSYKHNLNTLMTKVNRLVSKGRTEHGYLQVSTYESRLNKEFYFFPGLPKITSQLTSFIAQASD